MPIDAGDERWLNEKFSRLDKDVGHIFVAAQELSIKLNVMSERLDATENAVHVRIKATEDRNKVLWTIATSLILTLIGGFSAHMSVVGSHDATLRENAKAIEVMRVEMKSLATEFREHERRSSIPKPEPAKQPEPLP